MKGDILFASPQRLIGLIIALLTASSAARSQTAVFTLDPDRSSIGLKGNVLGFTLDEQGPGSLTTRFEGTIDANLTETTIQFPGTGVIRALENGNWQPGPGGVEGTAPANYGGIATSVFADAIAAGRGIEFQLLSEPIVMPGGDFSASSLLFQFVPDGASALDFRVLSQLPIFVPSTNGQLPLVGLATNQVAKVASLVTIGDTQTLTIPVEAVYTFTLLVENDGQLSLDGQLVATRSLGGGSPEEGSFGAFTEDYFPGVTDPAIVGPEADGDGDGLPLFAEFALGLDPTAADTDFRALGTRTSADEPGVLILQYERPKGLTGVSYRLEASTDWVTWEVLTTTPEITDLGNGRERVTVRDSIATAPGASRWIRLTVSMP